MKRIKMQLKRALVTALAVSMVVGKIDMSCLQVHATEAEEPLEQGTVENIDYETVHYFTDRNITKPTAENFQTNIENPQYTFTWGGCDITGEPIGPTSVPKKLGDYTLKVDVVSQTNGMTASLSLPVTVKVADINAVATVLEKEDGTRFVTWDEVVLAAPEGFAIAHDQSYWALFGDPKSVYVVDPSGSVAKSVGDKEVAYYLKEIRTGYISEEKTITVDVQEENAPALGAIINGKVLPKVDQGEDSDKEITYSYFLKSPASINISGFEEYQIVSENETYDEENEWTKDTGIFEFSDLGAYNIYTRTVEEGDGWQGISGQTTQGFILYKDSTQSTYKLVYTKTTNVDKLIKVAFNGNTVKSVSVGNTELAAEQYKVTTDGILLKSSYLEALNAGEYKVVVTYNPYGREYVDIEENEKPCQTEVDLVIEEFDNDDAAITTEETDCKIETTEGVAEVPESLSNIQNLDTVEKIEEQMVASVQKVNPDITVENTKTQEVTLLVKLAENEVWQEATEENFPEEGLTLTIAYPEGTSAETHDFVIAHMFTEGERASEIEYPEVTETADGLKFTVTGLSPITIGWAQVTSDDSTGEGGEGNTPSGGNTSGDSENAPSGSGASGSTANTPSGDNASGGSVNKTLKAESEMDEKADNSNVAKTPVLTSPATGDNANIALWCLIMLGCAVVGAAVLNRKKKQ